MAAGAYDLYIEQGATFRRTLTVKAAGVAVPLTGYTARAQIRAKAADAAVLHEITCTIPTPANGQIVMLITDEDTAAFTWKTGVWDLELETPTGDVTRLLKGSVEVDPEVTRPVGP
jgi:hypothetical protein